MYLEKLSEIKVVKLKQFKAIDILTDKQQRIMWITVSVFSTFLNCSEQGLLFTITTHEYFYKLLFYAYSRTFNFTETTFFT